MKITPGPWKASKDTDTRGNPCWRIDSEDVSLIAVLTYASEEERDAGEPDAKAIAALPDLIAALQEEFDWWNEEQATSSSTDTYTRAQPHIDRLRAALAKARP